VFLSSESGLVGQGFDIGRAVWAPGGELGNVTAAVAEGNSRAGYSTTYEARPDVETYLANRFRSEERFGLTVAERRAYFREVGQAGVRSYRDADAAIDPALSFQANARLSDELYERYVVEIRSRHGLTEEQHRDLMTEGFAKGWPQ